jgi:hypothetical protein
MRQFPDIVIKLPDLAIQFHYQQVFLTLHLLQLAVLRCRCVQLLCLFFCKVLDDVHLVLFYNLILVLQLFVLACQLKVLDFSLLVLPSGFI